MPIAPGIKYIMLAVLFFSLMNIGVKYLSHIPAYEIVFFRALVTFIVGFILIKKEGANPWGNNKRLLVLRGVFGTLALVMYFYTLHLMPLASAVTIQYLSPIFTIIISGFLLKEYPRPIQWLFFAMSFSGVLLIKGFDPRVTVWELVLGVSSAIFSALAYNIIRKLRTTDNPMVVVLYFPMVTIPVIGIYTAFNWVMPGGTDWFVLLLVGLTTTAMQIYLTKAYQTDRASNISNYNYLGTIYAILIGYVFFDETVTTMAFLGMAMIVSGIVMSSYFRR